MIKTLTFRGQSLYSINRSLGSKSILISLPNKIPFVLIAIGFLLGTATVYGELIPFGLAFVAALRATGTRKTDVLPTLAVMTGMFVKLELPLALIYCGAIVFIRLIKDPSHLNKPVPHWRLALICAFVLKTAIQYMWKPLPIVILIGVTECVIGAIAYSFMYKLLSRRVTQEVAYRETKWVLWVLAAIVSFDFIIFGLSTRFLLALYSTLIVARLGESSLSTIVGPSLGVVSLILGSPPEFGIALVITGVLAGAAVNYRGGLVVAPLLAMFLTRAGEIDALLISQLFTAVAASGLVFLTPGRALNHLARIIPGTTEFSERQASYTERVREAMKNKMTEYLSIFDELATAVQGRDGDNLPTQLENIADIIRAIGQEFSPGIHLTEKLEDDLMHKFGKFDFRRLTTIYGPDGYEIAGAFRKRCNGNKTCNLIAEYCSSNLDTQKYEIVHKQCGNGSCGFCIASVPRYRLDVENAVRAYQGISGDSQVVFKLSHSKVAVILSDGMGVGQKAHSESKLTIRLLKKMIKAGYDLNVAISLVNSVLQIRNTDEMCVTIDLVVIDLYTGQLEFLKIGSAPSFIKRGREVEIIQNQSLPVGILSDIDVETDRRLLKEGEVLILASDGVIDARRHLVRKEEWMCRNIARVDGSQSLDAISKQILANSIMSAHGEIQDDMMVIAARLVRVDQEIEAYRRTS